MALVVRAGTVRLFVFVSADDHARDEARRRTLKSNPANDCEHRLANTAFKPSANDESCRGGKRQSSEGLVPDILVHATGSVPRRSGSIGWNIHRSPSSGNTPYDPRSDVSDRKSGCYSQPRFAPNQVAKVKTQTFVLDVLPRSLVSAFYRPHGLLRGLATLIH